MTTRRAVRARISLPSIVQSRFPTLAGIAWLLLVVELAPSLGAQPTQFSGATCSMTNCDCNCIAGEEQRGDAAIASLRIEMPAAIIRTPRSMSPREALIHLQHQRYAAGYLRMLLNLAATDARWAKAAEAGLSELSQIVVQNELPPVPAGWTPKQYLDNLMAAGKPVIDRAIQAVKDERAIRREITDCRRFADVKQCDPSLGTAGEKSPTASTPPRQQTSPPPAVTPPRQMRPPDQPQPFARHPDGRPIVDDELITRYIAAKRAHDLQGGSGAYWREGAFGQADYAEVHARFDLWARTAGTPDRQRLFEQNELDACQHREKELRQALTGTW